MRITAVTAPVLLAAVAAVFALGLGTQNGSTARPAGDLRSLSCQGGELREVISEDFSIFNSNNWIQGGSAAWHDDDDNYYLTEATFYQAGRLFWDQRLSGCGFRAEFDYEIGGGSEADGLTFAVVTNTEYEAVTGGGLDFCPGDGAGIAAEFDSYSNGGTDPAGQHLGIVENCAYSQVEALPMTIRGEHHVVVDFIEGQFTIYLDGSTPTLTHTFPDMTFFSGYIGFTGATGGATDDHIVDNFTLSVINPHQGDFDCSGTVTGRDALLALLFIEELEYSEHQDLPCPPLDVELLGGFLFGDVNCDGAIDVQDAMLTIIFAAGFTLQQPVDCIPVGDSL